LVWLIGSRAAGSASPNSDWDYLVFADRQTFDDLARNEAFNDPEIDLLVVYDGDQFSKPWPDDSRQKKGSLLGWE
jgi:predicted nucleotidyltransferase